MFHNLWNELITELQVCYYYFNKVYEMTWCGKVLPIMFQSRGCLEALSPVIGYVMARGPIILVVKLCLLKLQNVNEW